MKIFGYEIKKEKRNAEITVPSFNDALTFSSVYNKYTALNISAVYRAVEIISDSIAILPIHVKQNEGSTTENIDTHPLNLVFKNGLHNLTKYNFMKLLIQSVLLKGNGFAYIKRGEGGTVTELRFLKSEDVAINYDERKGDVTYSCPTVSPKRIEPCNMVHLVKNTYDGVKGISVITFASRSINLANHTENSASNFFNNGCNLSGVLTVQGQLSAQQRQDIKNSWNQAYSEGGNGLAVLQGNMSYAPIQLNSRDSQLLESRLFNVSDIARFFGISPVLLGDLSHSSYSTIEACQQDFLLHTLQPYISMIEAEFDRKLLKPSESNLTVNLDEKYLLRTDKSATASYYNSLLNSGILSINEVRKELGYGVIEGGDKHTIAYTDINQNTINKKESEDSKNTEDVKDEKNL